MIKSLTALMLVGGLALTACGGSSEPEAAATTEPATADAPGTTDTDIVYLLPDEIPSGWTLRLATERTGPPPDYTMSWAPIGIAGKDRAEASDAPDEGPRLWINVGPRVYLPETGPTPPDAAGAVMSREGNLLHLRFVMSGILVKVGSQDATEDEIRRFAVSLQQHGHDEWREALGERLLIDRPD